jgi:hypothetical protein
MNFLAPILSHPTDESPAIALIGAHSGDAGQIPECQACQHTAFDRIRLVGGMDINRPHIALGVGRHLTAATFDLLTPMETALFPLEIGFHRLRVDEQVARSRMSPFFWREISLSLQQTSCQTPRNFMRRK